MYKRPMRVGLILLRQKLGRAPKSLLPAGDLCQFHKFLWLFCSQVCPTLRNRHRSSAILMIFLLRFYDGFIFVTRLTVFGEHTFETLASVANWERPYSGVDFELQLLSHVPSEMQIGEANVFFAGDVKQKGLTSKVR